MYTSQRANTIDKYARLVNKNLEMKQPDVNMSPDFNSGAQKMSFESAVVWLIYLKRVVKYHCPDFP